MFLLFVALCARVYYLRSHVVVLEGEGAGYAHQAEHLVSGRGFESYLYPRPDLEHCWLQPIFISAVYILVRNLDTATHIISLVSGTLSGFVYISDCRPSLWTQNRPDRSFACRVSPIVNCSIDDRLRRNLRHGAAVWGDLLSVRLVEHDGRWGWLFAGVLWGLSYLNRTGISDRASVYSGTLPRARQGEKNRCGDGA